jgi:hypothetical protein
MRRVGIRSSVPPETTTSGPRMRNSAAAAPPSASVTIVQNPIVSDNSWLGLSMHGQADRCHASRLVRRRDIQTMPTTT